MDTIRLRNFGLNPYEVTWERMRDFTDRRTKSTVDEIWWGQHFPVFTQGQAGKTEHLLRTEDIPVVQTDRGGQVTFHGPGQLILYTLVDLKRKNLGIRGLMNALENSMITILKAYGIQGATRCNAPGVYVEAGKIGSVGLRIRKGCSYHGLSLNVAMDLEPFQRINPCGYPNLKVVQMSDYNPDCLPEKVAPALVETLVNQLGSCLER